MAKWYYAIYLKHFKVNVSINDMREFLNFMEKSGYRRLCKKRMANVVGSSLIRPMLREFVLSIVEVSSPDNNEFSQISYSINSKLGGK